ncbi:unnamed protein product, partial [Vitis vinifera]|uniref:Uncharacterized protein n=1 Tax=Vitis vinifera TaxID=29760 RepID=D7TAX2_VITVI
MGQRLGCGVSHEHGLFSAVQVGDLESVESLLARDPNLLHQATVHDHHSAHQTATVGDGDDGKLFFLHDALPEYLFGTNFPIIQTGIFC